MSEPNGCAAGSFLASRALLLCSEHTTSEERNLIQMFDFFGIPWKAVVTGHVNEGQGRYAVVGSVDCLLEVLQDIHGSGEALPPWVAKASTVYVQGFQVNDGSTRLLRFLTGNPQARLRVIDAAETVMTITADSPEMCGPMSGMRVPVTLHGPGYVCDVGPGVKAFQSVVRADGGEVFFGVTCAGVRFYLNAWGRTVDISSLSAEYFDVKRFFGEAVPPVFYLKWAFRDGASRQNETNACLIVDDPPLKQRYGFLNFRQALDLMDRHNFTTTIAFIPWNWRRTHPPTLDLFRSRPERFSLVVHGCDHTAGEFAVRSGAALNRKIRTSRQRMECFQRRTSLKADHVMVFPQGEFSPETGRTLKLNGFVAAVNTEVAPKQRAANETQIADLWSVAIMKYGTFPIFTRRYSAHGIENFAFDGLLGKPCLIAAHHDVFRDHAQNLVDLIGRLNSLRWNLVWRSLGEVIGRSFIVRGLDDGTNVIRMFGTSVVVDNPDVEARKTLLLRQESDPDCVQAVWVNQSRADFSVEDGCLRLLLTAFPGQTAMIRVVYRDDLEPIPDGESSGTDLKVAARRYLSEFRDNYLSRSDFLYQNVNRVRGFIK